jgi:hypothetical protein
MDVSTLNELSYVNLRLAGRHAVFGTIGATFSWNVDQNMITVILGADCNTNLASRCFNPTSDVKDVSGLADATSGCVMITTQ